MTRPDDRLAAVAIGVDDDSGEVVGRWHLDDERATASLVGSVRRVLDDCTTVDGLKLVSCGTARRAPRFGRKGLAEAPALLRIPSTWRRPSGHLVLDRPAVKCPRIDRNKRGLRGELTRCELMPGSPREER